jgi:GAF domain-containing protein
MRIWAAQAVARLLVVPRPEDAPQGHSPGRDPDRILLLGGGPAVGWGVRSHDLALTGFLPRELTALTSRGAQVDTVADPDAGMAILRLLAERLRPERYDVIVICAGMRDAVRLTPVAEWAQQLESLLDDLVARAVAPTQLLVVGIQPVQSVSVYAGWPGKIADRHAAALNHLADAICTTRDRVSYSQLPQPGTAPKRPGHRTPAIYRDWGRAIANAVADALPGEEELAAARARRERADPEAERQGSLDRMDILETGADSRIDRLADHARQLYGTRFSAVTLIDGDHQRHVAILGADPDQTPRQDAICNDVIQRDGMTIYRDLWTEDAFRDNPLVHGDPAVRFYAGYPVRSPDGYRVGALCVYDSDPRPRQDIDEDTLGDLAHLVEKQLWHVAGATSAVKRTD